MSKIKKRITVRFFSIDAEVSFITDFVAVCQANQINGKPVRVFSVREKKHLVKIHDELEHRGHKAFFLSVVRERNTWQARALADGTISAIPLNQGILGDPYYFMLVPESKIILGFTTGPNASLRSVANTVMQQFRKDRTSRVSLEPISNEREHSRIKELVKYTEVRLSVNPAALSQAEDDLPDIFKGLKASPFLANSSKLELTVSDFGEGRFTQDDLFDVIDYLSDNECCTTLIVKGIDCDGVSQQINLNKTYLNYSTILELRGQFVDEKRAIGIVLDALASKDRL
ncbi:MAG: hypothetical protein KKF77_13435 [Proteobacteria bacterium]|nr:hypothetical protein [Pseudomonadota bacterium]